MKQQDSRTAPQRIRHARPEQCRRDGWTVRRQLAFLTVLQRTRSVTEAAKAAGMSRESAYRLRRREPDGLFAPGRGGSALGSRLLRRKLTKVTSASCGSPAVPKGTTSASRRGTVKTVTFRNWPNLPPSNRRGVRLIWHGRTATGS